MLVSMNCKDTHSTLDLTVVFHSQTNSLYVERNYVHTLHPAIQVQCQHSVPMQEIVCPLCSEGESKSVEW